MKKATNSDDKNSPAERALFDRREYLRLAGAAGVAGAGVSTLAGSAAANATLSRTLTIEGRDSTATYDFSVGGKLAKSKAMGATINSNDTLSGQNASGSVTAGGRDSYTFTEELTSFSVTNDPRLYLNGEPLTDTLVVEDIYEDRPTNYEIRVDGEVLKSTAMSGTIDASDQITPRNDADSVESGMTSEEELAGETYVFGDVAGGKDSYAVSGQITGFHADGQVNVYLNGKLIQNPSQFVRNTITLESKDGATANYTLAVSGDLAKSTWLDATINSDDVIDAGTATGQVSSSGRDSYVYTGEITDFSGSANIGVRLNGRAINSDTLSLPPQFENTLTLDGGGEPTTYRFTVEGELAENYGLADNDVIDGPVADGRVVSGQDSYTFTGDIANFTFEGSSNFIPYLNGQRVNRELLGNKQTAPAAETLPNEVTVTGIGTDRKEYGLSVTGVVSVDEDEDTSAGDNPAGSFARGFVTSGADVYRFSGDVESLTDYETFQVDVDYDNGTIDIEDFGSGTSIDYELTVSGDLSPTSTTDGSDTISGGTAMGTVNQGTDVYGFTGRVEKLRIGGKMSVQYMYVDEQGRYIESAIAAMNNYMTVRSDGITEVESSQAENDGVNEYYIQLGTELAEVNNNIVRNFKDGARNVDSELVGRTEELIEKFDVYFLLIAQNETTVNPDASESAEGVTTQGAGCGGGRDNPHRCPDRKWSGVYRDTKDGVRKYLKNHGYHRTADYATGRYGEDFTKPVSAYGCSGSRFRSQALIGKRTTGGRWTFNKQGPEPNPEVLRYIQAWPSVAWPSYVRWWHARFC